MSLFTMLKKICQRNGSPEPVLFFSVKPFEYLINPLNREKNNPLQKAATSYFHVERGWSMLREIYSLVSSGDSAKPGTRTMYGK